MKLQPIDAASSSHERYERALTMLHTHCGDPLAEVERLLADDPSCIPGHCLRAGLAALSGGASMNDALAASISAIESAGPTASERERRHAAAARIALEGHPMRALEHYGAIVVDWPRDILALTVAHALDFRLGRRRMLRDRVAQVLAEWDATVPGYASVLAMYAFGLEENGQRRRAEATARRALAFAPGHPGAIHVVAHVMEMQGRPRDGLAWLAATESSWAEGTGFSVHLAWHRGVFQLEIDDAHSALATYDSRLAPGHATNGAALVDASALLWRLGLRNVDLGDRWRVLADRWEARMRPQAPTFQAVHALMAFAVAGRDEAAMRVLDSIHVAATRAKPALPPDEGLAEPVCEALVAFVRKDFARCVERLNHVRHLAHRCGGSLAQCDLIHLTLTEAALRARQDRLARALTAERAAQRPASLLNRLLQARAARLIAAA
ncbi:MAG: tetratricopeptide repeat protein [Casimicrobiaceae bacterium]